jgi:hypothetical protein
MIGQARQHIGKPGLRIDVVKLGGLDQQYMAAARRPPSSVSGYILLGSSSNSVVCGLIG